MAEKENSLIKTEAMGESGLRQPETLEEELALLASAMEAGIDPFPPKKESSGLAKIALGWFMIVIMVSWVSQLLYRSL